MLDAFFAEARGRAPDPSPALVARVLADAEAEQARIVRSAAPGAARSGLGSAWRGVLDMLGGWGGIGGLAAAGITGIWIGVSGTGALGVATAQVWGVDAAAADAEFVAGDLLTLTLALEDGA